MSSKPSAFSGTLNLPKERASSFLETSSTADFRNQVACSSGVSSTAASALCTASSRDCSGSLASGSSPPFSWAAFSSSPFFSSPSAGSSPSFFSLASGASPAFFSSPSAGSPVDSCFASPPACQSCQPSLPAARLVLSVLFRARSCSCSCTLFHLTTLAAFSLFSARISSWIFALWAAGGSPITTMATFSKSPSSKFARDFCRSLASRLFRTSMTT
mmetsp:Transcript_33215/g.87870  ORF Transcript_33215/g.87870 Transcript_33215/m.87870 type:complete len:216 (+) Transcript_33215:405-1052(+)